MIQLYTGPCAGTLTQVAGGCSAVGLTGSTSEPALVFDAQAAGLPAGTVVWVRYWERNGNENGSFEICAYEAQRPPNDNPCGAIPLTVESTCVPQTYSTENASPLVSNMTTNPANPSCGTPATSDLWFSFVVPTPIPSGGLTVNTIAGTLNNFAMALYRHTSGNICQPLPDPGATLTQIACDIDQGGGNLMPRINSAFDPIVPPLIAGETIYIRIWNQAAAPQWIGTFSICVQENQPPPNDNPCQATALTPQYGCILAPFSNEGATPTPGAPSTSCAGTPSTDVWFSIVVPPNGELVFDTQAGTMTNAAMALYTAPNCNGPFSLIAGACAGTGSGQGSPQMPGLPPTPTNANDAITGLTPGSTVYLRVWQEGGTTGGTFNLCAERTDDPPGDCYYTLTMNDSGNNGWGGSYVTVCVAGNCADYTVNGSTASVNIGANAGDLITIDYTAAGGFQNQNSFIITQFGVPIYVSGTSPGQGSPYVYVNTVDCTPPPAPQSDCIGSMTLCSASTMQSATPQNTGGVNDLNSGNMGCLVGERQGLWFKFHIHPNSPPNGNLAFTIDPVIGTGNSGYTIFDFAIWGPYYNPPGSGPGGSLNWSGLGNACPPSGPPHRCNWYSFFGQKGLAYNNAAPTSVGGGGPAYVRHLTTQPNQVYIMYVDNWGMNGMQFSINWLTPPAAYQPMANVSCEILPIEMLSFKGRAMEDHVRLDWSTASETSASHYIVERSADGETFENIGRVNAVGNSTTITDYVHKDEAPLNGLSYYRLRQVDFDGATSPTSVVPVIFKRGRLQMDVFPNPTDDLLWVSFTLEKETQLAWRISDASGRKIMENVITSISGPNLIDIRTAKLDQGTYVLEVIDKETGERIGISRFVKR